MTAEKRVTMAFVGCGRMGQTHWRSIQAQSLPIDVTATVDPNLDRAKAMADETGGEAFATLEEALAQGDFDAVDLMVPHNLHVEAALASFAAGKHVVLEKPMAPTLAGCDQILAAAKAAGTVFMIAEQAQYWPDIHAAKALIEAGAIGDVISARAHFYDRQFVDPDDPTPWRYRLESSGGGIAMDGGAHWIRPLRIWFGEPIEVIAATGHPIKDMEAESLIHAILKFEGDMVATFTALNGFGPGVGGEAFRITGMAGEISIEHGREGQLLLFNEEHPTGKAVMDTIEGKIGGYGYELADFADTVLNGTPLAAEPEYALGELKTALAMYRSVESRTWEKV